MGGKRRCVSLGRRARATGQPRAPHAFAYLTAGARHTPRPCCRRGGERIELLLYARAAESRAPPAVPHVSDQAHRARPAPAGCLKNDDEYKSMSPNAASVGLVIVATQGF